MEGQEMQILMRGFFAAMLQVFMALTIWALKVDSACCPFCGTENVAPTGKIQSNTPGLLTGSMALNDPGSSGFNVFREFKCLKSQEKFWV